MRYSLYTVLVLRLRGFCRILGWTFLLHTWILRVGFSLFDPIMQGFSSLFDFVRWISTCSQLNPKPKKVHRMCRQRWSFFNPSPTWLLECESWPRLLARAPRDSRRSARGCDGPARFCENLRGKLQESTREGEGPEGICKNLESINSWWRQKVLEAVSSRSQGGRVNR